MESYSSNPSKRLPLAFMPQIKCTHG